MKSPSARWGLFAVTVFTCALFIYSVHLRAPWFGYMPLDDNLGWQTGSTLKFTDYWYQEGPLKLGFTMLENPPSVEFPRLQDRGIYSSYPPGAIIPVYLYCRVAGHAPDTRSIMIINLAGQLLIALCLGLLRPAHADRHGLAHPPRHHAVRHSAVMEHPLAGADGDPPDALLRGYRRAHARCRLSVV